jgi:hypothetical protein
MKRRSFFAALFAPVVALAIPLKRKARPCLTINRIPAQHVVETVRWMRSSDDWNGNPSTLSEKQLDNLIRSLERMAYGNPSSLDKGAAHG